jgi:hypothetical protein
MGGPASSYAAAGIALEFINIPIRWNIVVEWLVLVLHIWEVLRANLSLETGYPDRFYGSPQCLQANALIVP